MLYKQLSLYKITNNITFPQMLNSSKHLCVSLFGENVDSKDILLNINNLNLRNVFIPNYNNIVQSGMTKQYREFLIENNYKPIRGKITSINQINNMNFILDLNDYLDKFFNNYKLKSFNNPKSRIVINNYFSNLNRLDNTYYEKCLLYCVNMESDLNKFINRKSFILFNYMMSSNNVFDKVIMMMLYPNENKKEYVLIYDNSQKNKFNRVKSLLFNLHKQNKEELTEGVNSNLNKTLDTSTLKNEKGDWWDLNKVQEYLKNKPWDNEEREFIKNTDSDNFVDELNKKHPIIAGTVAAIASPVGRLLSPLTKAKHLIDASLDIDLNRDSEDYLRNYVNKLDAIEKQKNPNWGKLIIKDNK